jgi:hypothetical protein
MIANLVVFRPPRSHSPRTPHLSLVLQRLVLADQLHSPPLFSLGPGTKFAQNCQRRRVMRCKVAAISGLVALAVLQLCSAASKVGLRSPFPVGGRQTRPAADTRRCVLAAAAPV